MTRAIRPPSPIRIDGETAYIYLDKDHETKIDTSDVALVSNYAWRIIRGRKSKYACTGQTKKKTFKTLHQMILNPAYKTAIDHKDCDGLNNKRNNLRPASDAQNNANRGPNRRNILGIKGVSLVQRNNNYRYVAAVGIGKGRTRHIGVFDTPEEASDAYFKAAQEVHGEFARK